MRALILLKGLFWGNKHKNKSWWNHILGKLCQRPLLSRKRNRNQAQITQDKVGAGRPEEAYLQCSPHLAPSLRWVLPPQNARATGGDPSPLRRSRDEALGDKNHAEIPANGLSERSQDSCGNSKKREMSRRLWGDGLGPEDRKVELRQPSGLSAGGVSLTMDWRWCCCGVYDRGPGLSRDAHIGQPVTWIHTNMESHQTGWAKPWEVPLKMVKNHLPGCMGVLCSIPATLLEARYFITSK